MLLEALQNPLVIAVVVLILLLLIAIPVVVRRRRASAEEVLPPPELGQSIDYTSLPYEEPSGWRERFARAPVATKLLLVLVPLVLIVSLVVLAVTFLRPSATADTQTPVVPPATITNVSANVAGKSKILVKAETTLPDGTAVVAALKENGQDFAWYNPQTATAQAADGRISLTMDKLNNAPVPNQDQEYTVVLAATLGGQTISSEPAKLAVPTIYQGAFFATTASAPTSAPTTAPATTTTAGPAAPTPAPEVPTPPPPTATTTTTLTATVANGGNIRQSANLSGKVLGQLHAGEVVKLLEKSSDGRWYHVEAPEATGWVSATLLRIDRAVADQVPTPTTTPNASLTATVFNGGNLRDQPTLSGKVLDQINAGEKVQLLEKTRDGAWYKITNIRNKTGWVSKTLLTIAQSVIDQVPLTK
jgi:flagellar FliL protein